jgi:hypothetical protein
MKRGHQWEPDAERDRIIESVVGEDIRRLEAKPLRLRLCWALAGTTLTVIALSPMLFVSGLWPFYFLTVVIIGGIAVDTAVHPRAALWASQRNWTVPTKHKNRGANIP